MAMAASASAKANQAKKSVWRWQLSSAAMQWLKAGAGENIIGNVMQYRNLSWRQRRNRRKLKIDLHRQYGWSDTWLDGS